MIWPDPRYSGAKGWGRGNDSGGDVVGGVGGSPGILVPDTSNEVVGGGVGGGVGAEDGDAGLIVAGLSVVGLVGSDSGPVASDAVDVATDAW
jgi:hypothetical protein